MPNWRGLAAIAVSCTLLGGLLAVPAQADQRTASFTWRWKGVSSNPRCTLVGSVAAYASRGHVVVRGAFDGCGRGGTGGSRDGILTVIGWGPDGRQHGGNTRACLSSCAMNVKVPYKGKGTYYGLIYVSDGGYLLKKGHDPSVRPFSSVSGSQ